MMHAARVRSLICEFEDDRGPEEETDDDADDDAGADSSEDSSEAEQAATCPTFARCQRFVDSLGLPGGTLDAEHNICYCHARCAHRHPDTLERGPVQPPELASRSLPRALFTPQVNPGSPYRRGESTLKTKAAYFTTAGKRGA